MPTDRMNQLLELLQGSPGDSFLLFAVAKEYEGAGALDQALAHYRTLEEKDPGYVGLYYHLGKLLEYLEQPEEAKAAYEKGMATAKIAGDRHAWNELSAALMDMEEV